MRFASGFQVAQSRPSGTSAVSAYTASLRTEISLVNVCNTTSSPANFSLYHDDDGSTFDETSALHYAQLVPANTTVRIEFNAAGGGLMVSEDGQIGVQTSVANALTFSIYGITQEAR